MSRPGKKKITEAVLKQAYEMFGDPAVTIEQFKEFAVMQIESAQIPNPGVLNAIRTAKTKDQIVFKFSNFAMKGHGYGVMT